MSSSLKDIEVTGLVSKIMNEYVITTDDGTEYRLSAILPWEAVAADFDMGKFAIHLGKHVTITGQSDGRTIWGASVSE